MYYVRCDGIIIHDLEDGDKVLQDCNLTMEDNDAGSLVFTMNPKHPHYNIIKDFVSVIEVLEDDNIIWAGRSIGYKTDMFLNRNYTIEGELCYLLDTVQPPKKFTDYSVRAFLGELLENHNRKVERKKQFILGAVTVNKNNLYRFTNYDKTMDCIKDKLIKQLGGHILVRYENGRKYLDYIQDFKNEAEQVIEFGENLLDYADNLDMTDIATVLIPIGATIENHNKETEVEGLEDHVQINSVNNGKDYIESPEAIKTLGRVEKVAKWDDVHEPKILLTKAKKYLEEYQFNRMSLEIRALDMNLVNKEIKPLKLLDMVRAISKPHGLNAVFPVSKLVIPLARPDQTTLTLGWKNGSTPTITQSHSQAKKEQRTMRQDFSSMAFSQMFTKSKMESLDDNFNLETNTGLGTTFEFYSQLVQRWANGKYSMNAGIVKHASIFGLTKIIIPHCYLARESNVIEFSKLNKFPSGNGEAFQFGEGGVELSFYNGILVNVAMVGNTNAHPRDFKYNYSVMENPQNIHSTMYGYWGKICHNLNNVPDNVKGINKAFQAEYEAYWRNNGSNIGQWKKSDGKPSSDGILEINSVRE